MDKDSPISRKSSVPGNSSVAAVVAAAEWRRTLALEVYGLGAELDVAAIHHLLDRVEEGVRNAQRNLLGAGLSAARGYAGGAVGGDKSVHVSVQIPASRSLTYRYSCDFW
jgi:hypothetical protein